MRTSLLALPLLIACGGAPAPEAPPAEQAASEAPAAVHVDLDDPSACAACHGTVAAEWEQSMHARAHHESDPIYGAMRRFRMGKEGAELGKKCNQCHTPRAPGAEDSAAAKAGVSCATCHTTVALADGKKGAGALVAGAEGVLHGPHDLEPGASPAHGTGAASPVIAEGTVCLACHSATKNPQGVAACTTGPEHAAVDGGASCTSCHMPTVDGQSGVVSQRGQHASHAFLGPHRAWYQDDPAILAAALQVEATWQDAALQVVATNVSEHAVPTGFPGRIALLRVTGKDAAGEVVWRSATDDPMTQSPEALWNKVYVDAEGQPTMPPYAAELKADRRLQAGETRTLSFAPPEGVVSADVELVFRLLPPPAAKTLGIADRPEAEPRVATLTTVTR